MGSEAEKVAGRPGRGRGRLGSRRRPVPADGPGSLADPRFGNGDDDDLGGSAGVREPRQPKPLGPMSGAGEMPIPQPPTYLVLSDPRR